MHYESARMLIYISKAVASDSAFPFKPGDDLWITIDRDGSRLVVERVKGRKTS